MKITRTYPQPDSPQPHIGPRERALGVLKYLLNMEPEAAAKHSLFPLLVASFEQAQRQGRNAGVKECEGAFMHGCLGNPFEWPKQEEMPPSCVELLTGTSESAAPVSMQKFEKPGNGSFHSRPEDLTKELNLPPGRDLLDGGLMNDPFTKDGL